MDVPKLHRLTHEQRMFDAIKALANEHVLNSKNLVFKKGDSITAFKDYTIAKNEQGFVLVTKNSSVCFTTTSVQYALSWCIADKYQDYDLREDIEHYARLIELRSADVKNYKQAVTTATSDTVYILLNRLEDAILQLAAYRKQISKCVKIAKYRQQKGFDNETSRIGLDSVRKFSKNIRKSL